MRKRKPAESDVKEAPDDQTQHDLMPAHHCEVSGQQAL